MVRFVSKKEIAVISVAIVALLYQLVFKQIIFGVFGYGRHVLSIKDFPHVRCEKVIEPGLQGCEDMWLHESTGFLYMACSDSISRPKWTPAYVLTLCLLSIVQLLIDPRIGALDAKERGKNDRLAVLDTRGSGPLSSRLKWIKPEGFSGINGDGTLNLHGLDIWESAHSPMLRILLVNHRPPINPATGEVLDAFKVGANSTIEQFLTKVGTDTMRHIKTFADPLISTPNRPAWVTDHSFLVTNDNGPYKTGLRRALSPVIGGSNVVYCNRHVCNKASSHHFKIANGLVRGRDGLIYVPNTAGDTIDVFALNEKHTLEHFHSIKVPLPIDNLSVDKNGEIYAAAFPKIYRWAESARKPFQVDPPSSVLRIKRGGMPAKAKGRLGHLKSDSKDYWVEEIMEDDGSVLPGSTIAIHDAETGRFFMGGVMSPFITICETR